MQPARLVERQPGVRGGSVGSHHEVVEHGEGLSLCWLAGVRRKHAKQRYGECRRDGRGNSNRGCHDAHSPEPEAPVPPVTPYTTLIWDSRGEDVIVTDRLSWSGRF